MAAVDADRGGCTATRRSTSRFPFANNASPVFRRSKRQLVVVLSSGEAEYVAVSACAKEVTWLHRLTYEIVNQQQWKDQILIPATVLQTDSSAAMKMCIHRTSSKHTKHIALGYHHIRNLINENIITLEYCPLIVKSQTV